MLLTIAFPIAQVVHHLESRYPTTVYVLASMVKLLTAAAIAALTLVAAAARCQNLTVPISVAARNGNFNLSNPTDAIDATNFALRMSRQGHNYTAEVLNEYNTVSGDYNISATYCEPDAGSSKVVQVLTHGIGFDRR